MRIVLNKDQVKEAISRYLIARGTPIFPEHIEEMLFVSPKHKMEYTFVELKVVLDEKR